MAPNRISEAAKTDSSGRYTVLFAEGTGDYLVHISAIGYDTYRKRVTRTGSESSFTVDAKLMRTGAHQNLAAVKVSATKPTVGRDDRAWSTEVGSSERKPDGVNGAVSPELAGDLTALGGMIPGVASTPGGLSIGGLSSAQNSTTLNGMAFGSGDIPRGVSTTVRFAGSSYDPSRGWFGGVNEDVTLSPGSLFAFRQAELSIDAPHLQYTDPVSAGLGQRFSNVVASFAGSGAMDEDKFVFNYGLQAGRRVADAITLSDAAPGLLQHAGVSADSAGRFLDLLSTAGVPSHPSSAPSQHLTQNVSFLGRIDHAPYNWTSDKAATTTWGLIGYGKVASDNASDVSATSTAGQGGSSSQAIGMLQALFSTYIHGDYLNEERSAFTLSRDHTSPYLGLPNGKVLVASSFPDGTGGLTSLDFGGNGTLPGTTNKWTWETTSATDFYLSGRDAHRVTAKADSRFDGIRQEANANSLGTYSFSSLGDLAANSPSSFSRSLDAPPLHGSVWNGFVSIGDLWRKSSTFQLLYGARFEANRYTSQPEYNPAVESTFGVRTDHVPNTIHVSPRVGFTWVRKPAGPGISMSQLGQFSTGPTTYIRGGIGEFRNIFAANLLTQASIATGLPSGLQSLTCLGAATPTPDWAEYLSDASTIPTQCLDGSMPAFSDAAPSVQLFDRNYTAPRSWRANLSYASSYKLLTYSIEGIYSLNLDQPGRTNLNFSDVPRFSLSDEKRPVFVGIGSIVPSSGTVSPVQARVSPLFGQVIDNVSALRSQSRQATISLSPVLDKISNWYFSLNYTIADTRARQSGFDVSTFASPGMQEWARGDLDVRHQLLLQGGYKYKRVAVTFFGRLQSGLPFTPMIGSDVNGDGLANDRAFIFNPATMADASLAAATRTLLATSSPSVRDCLTRQMGAAAGRNSCEGPWTTSLNGRLSYGAVMPVTRKYGTISLSLSNPLGGLDQLLHGTDHLRGWGTQAYPNPILYTPRGFDDTNMRFNYQINPRFGDTRPTNTLLRVPLRVTLDVSLEVGRPFPQQMLNHWLNPGRNGRKGPRLTSKELQSRYAHNVPNPYKEILEESDSLLLTREQADQIQTADAAYRQRMDSVWKSLGDYFAALGDNFDSADALKRQQEAVDAGWEISRIDIQRTLPSILSPIQLKLLPWIPALLLNSKEKVTLRIFSMSN
jgi:hypothetical protein